MQNIKCYIIMFYICACLPALADDKVWSPDGTLYAIELPGQKLDRGEERERIVVYSASGKEVAVAHVWLQEPDGTMRMGIRGCEGFGWIDSTKFFCSGTTGPHVGVYITFDAQTGRELNEDITSDFDRK